MPEQRWIRSSLVWIVLIVAVLAMWAMFVGNDATPTPRSIGQVAQEIREGKVSKLIQADGSQEVAVQYAPEAGRRDAVTSIPAETDLLSVLKNYGIEPSTLAPGLIDFEPASRWGAWLGAARILAACTAGCRPRSAGMGWGTGAVLATTTSGMGCTAGACGWAPLAATSCARRKPGRGMGMTKTGWLGWATATCTLPWRPGTGIMAVCR